jgi:GTP cyclohydrolase I
VPFHGRAYVGYIAHEQIIGISKLTRLVRLFARRFTVQERVGQQIADSLEAMLEPHGVAVYLEAHHLCTQMRGVQEASPLTRTTFWRGEYETNPALRSEFLVAAGLQR